MTAQDASNFDLEHNWCRICWTHENGRSVCMFGCPQFRFGMFEEAVSTTAHTGELPWLTPIRGAGGIRCHGASMRTFEMTDIPWFAS
jgi:hypothetical protein